MSNDLLVAGGINWGLGFVVAMVLGGCSQDKDCIRTDRLMFARLSLISLLLGLLGPVVYLLGRVTRTAQLLPARKPEMPTAKVVER